MKMPKVSDAEFNQLIKSKLKTEYEYLHEDINWSLVPRWETFIEDLISNRIQFKEYKLKNIKYLKYSPIINLNFISTIIKSAMAASLILIFFQTKLGIISLLTTVLLKIFLDVIRNNSYDKWRYSIIDKLKSDDNLEALAEFTIYSKCEIIKLF